MFESIGPVWDGNEVWLVIAGGATFAAFPAWYATMFSGFYLALLLILVFLIVRVVSFEWREQAREPALADDVAVGEHGRAASARRSSGASRSPTSSTASRSTRAATSPATFSTSSAPTPCSPGIAVVLALRLPRRDLPDAADDRRPVRARGATARRLALPAAVVGAAFLAWTVAVAVDRNDKRRLPAGRCRRRSAIAALVLAVAARARAAAAAGRSSPTAVGRGGLRWRRSSPASTRA